MTPTETLEGLLSVLSRVDADASDAQRIDQLAMLEKVKSVAAATQARITVDFVESQEQVARQWRERAQECVDGGDFEGWRAARERARRATLVDAGPGGGATDGSRQARPGGSRRAGTAPGVQGQVALARRVSPSRGSRLVAAALTLVREMPHTLAALQDGTLSEWRAELVTRETAVLSPDQRMLVDAELAETIGAKLGMLGDRELSRRVRAIACRVDPQAVTNRCRGAASDRRVTIRPAPDCMTYVTAFLPVEQGVAVHASLTKAAAAARAEGDERTKGQLMADTLVVRVTGQADPALVPVEVQLVMTDRALLAGDETPAHIPGYGPVPAGWARDLVAGTPTTHGAQRTEQHEPNARAEAAQMAEASEVAEVSEMAQMARMWLRRLYTHPADGTLVGMDSTRRVFEAGLRRFLVTRDGTCLTPWCDAPIQHIDHVVEHAAGGPTSAENAQGFCARCNYTKQHPGWHAEVIHRRAAGGAHTVVTTTPTGHRYRSTSPPVIAGQPPPDPDDSVLERHLEKILAA